MMTPKETDKFFEKNARYYERGLWNGDAPRPRYAIRTPAGSLLTADDVADLREQFNAYGRDPVDESSMTRQDYDELDPPEGGD